MNYNQTHYRPTAVEKLAIEARLNALLGAKTYDNLFLGFECGDVIDGIAHVYASSEYFAMRIDAGFQQQIAIAVESVLRRPITIVNVMPKDFADSPPFC